MNHEDLHDGAVPYLLGALVIFVLLLVLHQVLREAVRQGATLKITYAERVETNWRCSAAHGPRERENCVARRTHPASKDSGELLATAEMRKP
ncbi:MAG: hypothetical protein H7Y28_10675 [Rhodoferax sp.]|nr:hypothetical protein [Rhodoferax sp.]